MKDVRSFRIDLTIVLIVVFRENSVRKIKERIEKSELQKFLSSNSLLFFFFFFLFRVWNEIGREGGRGREKKGGGEKEITNVVSGRMESFARADPFIVFITSVGNQRVGR